MRRTSIVVLGMHRSGTSAITRLLNIAGASLPKRLMPPGEYNKRGHWEPAELVEFHDRLLSDLGSRWDDWRPLRLDSLTDVQRSNAKAGLREILSTDYGEAPLIVIKDPRVCRLAPLLLEALDEAAFEVKVIMAIRNPLEVAASLMRRDTDWSDEKSPAYAGLLWLRHVLDGEAATRMRSRTVLTFDRLLADWKSTFLRLTRDLDIVWPSRLDEISLQVDAFIAPEERHFNRTNAAIRHFPTFGNWIADTFKALLALEHTPRDSGAIAVLDRIRGELSNYTLVMAGQSFEAVEAFATRQGLDVYLLVNEERLDSVHTSNSEWVFFLPSPIRSLQFRCQEVSSLGMLGLSLSSIEVRTGVHVFNIPLDHPGLLYDIHNANSDESGIHLTTDASVWIPTSLLGDCDSRLILTIRGAPQLIPVAPLLSDPRWCTDIPAVVGRPV
jgi:hypothetical protein